MEITKVTNRVKKLIKGKGKRKTVQTNPKTEPESDANVYSQLVEMKAYELFEKKGRQDGHDLDDWLEAERIVEEEIIAGK